MARKKAAAYGFDDVAFDEGDAERLPFPDASFDLVVSTCGHMFAPDQEAVARELARVVRPGGRIAFQTWTPEGGLGRFFRVMNRHVPPPPGAPSPFHWGDPEKVRALLGERVSDVRFEEGDCVQVAETPEQLWDVFRTRYGPTVRAVSSLAPEAAQALDRDMVDLFRGYRAAADGRVRWGREYLVTLARRS